MFSGLETGIGLDIVLALQSMESPLLDLLAQALFYIGVNLLLLVILPAIYWSVNQGIGARLLVALAVAALANAILKDLFGTPRPFDVSDEVIVLIDNTGYGFPSGHVMVTVVVWGYVAIVARRWWVTALVVVYTLAMMWSRMYLGAHYPQDVIGGVVFGLIVLWLFVWAIKALPVGWWSRLNLQTRVAMLVLLVIVAAVFTLDTTIGDVIVGVIAGIGFGVLVMNRLRFTFDVPPTFGQKIIVIVFGLVVTLGVLFVVDESFEAISTEGSVLALLLNIIQFTVLAFVITAAYPLLAARLDLVEAHEPRFS